MATDTNLTITTPSSTQVVSVQVPASPSLIQVQVPGFTGLTGPQGPPPVIVSTSTTSVTIATGSKTFATATALSLSVGQTLKVYMTATPVNYMVGDITAISGTSVTINVTEIGGSGTSAAWTLALGSYKGAQGIQGIQGNTGPTNTLTIGTVTTLASGASATATVTGTAPNQTLNLGIPQGATGAGAPDATSTSKGSIQLAGDLGGTAASPTVPALANKANTSITITAGTGLTGGGDLTVARTLAVSYGSAAGTAVQGNDIRVTADQAATQASIRTIGTGALQAAAGNHTHTSTAITDSTTVGRSVLTAVDAPTARTAIGAGTSSLVIGTSAGTAKDGAYQPTSANISDSTAIGRSVLTAATTAAGRLAIASAADLPFTVTKTTAYTVAANEIAVMNVSGGATVLTLPSAPAGGTMVGFYAQGATTATPLTINRGGTDTIGVSGATSVAEPLNDVVRIFRYDAPNTRWLPVADVKPLASLDARYAALSHTHTASQISDSTTTGRSLMTAASAQAARTTLGTNGISGGITDIQQISQSAYTALGAGVVATTMYVIVG